MSTIRPFWETKSLKQMTKSEWEQLCDGCGRCCIYILHNEDTGQVFETDVACRLFDAKKRTCMDYDNRHILVPDCVSLNAENVGALHWMPATCAYRRLANDEALPDWHPLITGDRNSVVKAGIAVSARLANEGEVSDEELEDRITCERE